MLFTGTGRCGTGYVAALMTKAGYPCGHEAQCSVDNWIFFDPYKMRGSESSWLALDCDDFYQYAHLSKAVIHVTRNREDVARSMARTRVMADLDYGYGWVHATILPPLLEIGPTEDRIWAWIDWVHGYLVGVPTWDVSEPLSRLAELSGTDVGRLEKAAEGLPVDVNAGVRKLPQWWMEKYEA